MNQRRNWSTRCNTVCQAPELHQEVAQQCLQPLHYGPTQPIRYQCDYRHGFGFGFGFDAESYGMVAQYHLCGNFFDSSI